MALATSTWIMLCFGFWLGLIVLLEQRAKQQQHCQTQKLMQSLYTNFTEQLHRQQLEHQQELQNIPHQLSLTLAKDRLVQQQLITDTLNAQMRDVREQMNHSFKQHADALTVQLQALTTEIRHHLHQLTQQVNQQLNDGFEKTSQTFARVVTRLSIIDEAQKKIAELSSHVISLQDVLVDKRARGAFGEVQLATLIANFIPSAHYALQFTLSNQKRADCVLFMPDPSGHLVIDAKFPLENYRLMINQKSTVNEQKTHKQQFRQDVQKHMRDIAEKYIIPNETSDGAVMFLPAEAIFSEIHSNHSDLVTLSQRLNVWLVSPNTLMAVLTTARAVLKDDATRKQIHLIRQHLHALSDDFLRFEKRMDKLSKHIGQVHQDASDVSTSAKKITRRFQHIEAVELQHDPLKTLLEET